MSCQPDLCSKDVRPSWHFKKDEGYIFSVWIKEKWNQLPKPKLNHLGSSLSQQICKTCPLKRHTDCQNTSGKTVSVSYPRSAAYQWRLLGLISVFRPHRLLSQMGGKWPKGRTEWEASSCFSAVEMQLIIRILNTTVACQAQVKLFGIKETYAI